MLFSQAQDNLVLGFNMQLVNIQQFMDIDQQQLKDRQVLYRDKQAAEYLNVGRSTIWFYTKQGKLKAIKLSDRVTVWAKSELDAFIQSRMNIA